MKFLHIDKISPPWRTTASWKEANCIIRALVKRFSNQLKSARSLASSVCIGLESIFSLLDDICIETCPYCPDPCCLKASPWFDYRDLVFLHLNELAIPSGQPISHWKATCRYYHPRGCSLDRSFRPWICTWYLCAVQAANLKYRRFNQRKNLTRSLNTIKTLRKEMEDEFIRVVV